MEQGATEQAILRQCAQLKLPIPDAIANAPILTEGLELYFMAFLDLTTCRSYGMSEGPIPWTAIKDWATYNGLSVTQTEDLFYMVREMDNAYLDYRAKKQKQK
nr:MAG TPA: hypothetical protein [Caudoviricetes sp.]